jgi:hypothetical protein
VSLPPAVRATVDEYLSQIQSDVTTMSGLITDLLELSRINHSTLRLKRVNLAELAQSIVTDLQRHDVARAQHVTLLLPTPSSVEKAAAGSVRHTPLARCEQRRRSSILVPAGISSRLEAYFGFCSAGVVHGRWSCTASTNADPSCRICRRHQFWWRQ